MSAESSVQNVNVELPKKGGLEYLGRGGQSTWGEGAQTCPRSRPRQAQFGRCVTLDCEPMLRIIRTESLEIENGVPGKLRTESLGYAWE